MTSGLVRVLWRTEPIVSIYQKRKREIYYKQLVHVTVRPVKSKVCKAGGRLRPRKELML